MTTVCPRCSLPFDTSHSAAQHAWKQEDEDHEDLESLDEALEEMFSNGKSPDDEPSIDGVRTVNHGESENGSPNRSEPSTDGGGPQSVPTFDVDEDDVQEDDVQEASADAKCPDCGSTYSFPVEMLPDALLEYDEDLAARDRVCADCSFEDDGSWATEEIDGEEHIVVEAFDVDGGAA